MKLLFCIPVFYDKVDIGEDWDKESSRKLMQYWLLKQSDLCLVATIEGKIVGGFMAGIKP